MKTKMIQVTTLVPLALLCCLQPVRATVFEWTIASGGNGHFYEAVSVPASLTWTDASALATAGGGYLATLNSGAENDFVFALVDSPIYWASSDPQFNASVGPWLGGFQPAGSPEPGGNWQWVSGEPFTFTDWNPGEPNNSDGNSNALHYFTLNHPNRDKTWNDVNQDRLGPLGYVVEYNTQPTPEPTSTVLLGVGAFIFARRRSLRTE